MLMFSESKAQAKTKKTFSQEKLALLIVPTHGQAENNVDKTAGNIPRNFRKPLIQKSENDVKTFSPIHCQIVPMNSLNAVFTAIPEIVFSKNLQFFRKLLSWLNTEETSSGRDFFSKSYCGPVDCSFYNPIGKLWPINRIVFPQNPKMKNNSKVYSVPKWSSRHMECCFFFNSAEKRWETVCWKSNKLIKNQQN